MDEVNLVKPGFNSGWSQFMGLMLRFDNSLYDHQMLPNSFYSDRQLSWRELVALTDLEFFTSSKLGDIYL